MGLPMPDPYRGFAPVTHDTNRTAEVITELNDLNNDVVSNTDNFNAHNGGNGHAGIYSPSANQYYIESQNGDGGSLVQTISNNTTTLLDLGTPVTSNGGGFSGGADSYTVPGGGIYVAHMHVRIWDSSSPGNIGLQLHNSSGMGHYTAWYQHDSTGGSRQSCQYMRVASWNVGTVLRAYIYQDTGFALLLSLIFFSIWRIG